ncbi:unnamed protein product [Microthlaspi erraticum]|uniref:DUF1985 domain-containing protein n=1 Tax=Microthlaspi erraticum TaxID=1685480 RepID=A0A6D2I0X6_9BRAS|nr:unnamed protein product [Microthlaspi erraticum]
MWVELFGKFKKPTAAWLLDKLLLGRKYKDGLTRFRLALLLLVEGIMCPSSGTMFLDPEVVDMVSDVEAFIQYPWGRKSVHMTVESSKDRKAEHLVQETIAIQGFAHAMPLLTAACCPDLMTTICKGEYTVPYSYTVEEIIDDVITRCLSMLRVLGSVITYFIWYYIFHASVRSILSSGCGEGFEEIHFEDEDDDEEVEHMLALINDEFTFEVNSWRGGMRDYEDETVPGDGSGNIANLISPVADVFEMRSKEVFATYVNSIKTYIDTVAEKLKTDI